MKGSTNNTDKPIIQKISKCVVKPKHVPTEAQKKCYLTPWDLALISIEYGQGGLLFQKPHNFTIPTILELLKHSLSTTLSYYFILAGRLETTKTSETPSAYSIFIDCSDFPGAEFIFAEAKEVKVSDITSPYNDIVESFFPFTERVPMNHEGHTIPLLYVQVTDLADGIFLGCAANHSVIDGSSYWHFLHTWSEISSKMVNGSDCTISHPPIFTPWSMDNHGPIIKLPSSFIEEMKKDPPPSTSPPPLLRNRVFKLTAKSLVELKAQAIAECENNDKNISSFQALNAFLWRCITRARHLPSDQKTTCILTADNRTKLQPALCKDNIGCYVSGIGGTTTAGELLANNLGWSASILHEAVIRHTSEEINTWLKDWIEAPSTQMFGENVVVAGNSPRFEVYNDDFGWGKPVSVSIGRGNKIDGTMFFHQSREGGGNIDVELNLYPEFMNALLLDPEFVNRVYC